jgi:hypothetical protein
VPLGTLASSEGSVPLLCHDPYGCSHLGSLLYSTESRHNERRPVEAQLDIENLVTFVDCINAEV